MRSLAIRSTVLLLQFILLSIAVNLVSILIARLYETYYRRYRRLPMIEFLPCSELLPQKTTD